MFSPNSTPTLMIVTDLEFNEGISAYGEQ